MDSGVDPRSGSGAHDVTAAVRALVAEALDEHDVARFTELARLLDEVRRLAEVGLAEVVAAAEECRLPHRDGHRNVVAWARAEFGCSTSDARRVARNGRMVRRMPLVRAAAHRGCVGVAQLDELGRAHANDRAAESMPEFDDLFARAAFDLRYDAFETVVRRWENLADADGTRRRHDLAHHNRRAWLRIVGDEAILHARGGVIAGVEIREVLDRFAQHEFELDWADARSRHGADTTAAHLARTDAQRRFDAFHAMCLAAAGATSVKRPDPLVNVVVDQRTLEDQLIAAATGSTPERPTPPDLLARRCETVDGVPIDPRDALAAVLVGHVRRMVVDAAGVVIDLGRRSRFYRGGARDAVLLSSPTCTWPGCAVRGVHSQIDHLLDWVRGGCTDPEGGGPACGHHHRFRHVYGYSATRDADGVWHTYRPDGTEVGRPPPPDP